MPKVESDDTGDDGSIIEYCTSTLTVTVMRGHSGAGVDGAQNGRRARMSYENRLDEVRCSRGDTHLCEDQDGQCHCNCDGEKITNGLDKLVVGNHVCVE